MRAIMLDLETMGTAPGSPVVAIGAVRFNLAMPPKGHDSDCATNNHGSPELLGPCDCSGSVDLFYQPITLESCMALGLRPSASTITWWLTNKSVTDEARSLFVDPRAVALPLALDAFIDWINSEPVEMWGNSAAFDCGLLAAAYTVCGKETPWAFWRERCYRTVKSLPGAEDVELVRTGTHHNALDDAISQVAHLRAIYQKLGL